MTRWGIFGLSLLLAFAGCGDDGGETSETPVIVSSAVIGPAGGTLAAIDYTLTVPPTAVSANHTFSLASAADLTLPAGEVRVGSALDVQPSSLTLSVPARIDLPYDAAAIPSWTDANFIVVRQDDSTILTPTTIDTLTQLVSVHPQTLGRFQPVVQPFPRVFVELTWTTPGDPDETDVGIGAGSDMNLHLHRTGTRTWMDSTEDCHADNPSPAWGALLNQNDTDGAGPERISMNAPGSGTYSIGVHYRNDNGFGMSYATVRITIDGVLQLDNTAILSSTEYFWHVADLNWPGGAIDVVNVVTPLVP